MNHFKQLLNLEFDLLQAKYVYYKRPELDGISDCEYDQLEADYRKLANKLEVFPWILDMVEYHGNHMYHDIIVKSVEYFNGVEK